MALTVHNALTQAVQSGEAAGIEDSRVDFQVLLAWVLHASREDLIRDPQRFLTHREELIFSKAIQLRLQRRPVPYITGEKWFHGRLFKVNRAVLIPRPETELLVEFAIEKVGELDDRGARVADIGTGSGCIAVSIACKAPQASVFATDNSPLALKVAARNVRRYGMENRVLLAECDLLSGLQGMRFDVIVSNPPYVREDEMQSLMPEVRSYEPPEALYLRAGCDGCEFHRRLLCEAVPYLRPGGWLAMEVGASQARSVVQTARSHGYKDVEIRKDLSGIERVVAVRI